MIQPTGLQTELMQCSRPVREWVMSLSDEIVRLENKVASLRKQHDDTVIQHVAEVKRLRAENADLDALCTQLSFSVDDTEDATADAEG